MGEKEILAVCINCGNELRFFFDLCSKCGSYINKMNIKINDRGHISAASLKFLGEIAFTIRKLRDFRAHVRLKTLKSLDRERLELFLFHLVDLLDDEEKNIRLEAFNLLENVNHSNIFYILAGRLNNKDPKIRLYLLKSLVSRNYNKARPYLLKALNDEDFDIRNYALEVISK